MAARPIERVGPQAVRRERIEPFRGDFWFAVCTLACCVGACVLVNVVGALRNPWFDANIWWLDLRLVPPWGRLLLPAATGVVLLGFAARPEMSVRRRMVSRAVAGSAAAVAIVDTIRFYVLWNDGSIVAKSPVPVSIVVTAAMLLFAVAMREPRPAPRSWRAALGIAVSQGVPARAIVLDPTGINTLASVEGTADILRQRGLSTVLAVSQPYHLPRIKLAYARSGLDVWTVPAKAAIVPRTGAIVAREIPAFWLYYLRAALT